MLGGVNSPCAERRLSVEPGRRGGLAVTVHFCPTCLAHSVLSSLNRSSTSCTSLESSGLHRTPTHATSKRRSRHVVHPSLSGPQRPVHADRSPPHALQDPHNAVILPLPAAHSYPDSDKTSAGPLPILADLIDIPPRANYQTPPLEP